MEEATPVDDSPPADQRSQGYEEDEGRSLSFYVALVLGGFLALSVIANGIMFLFILVTAPGLGNIEDLQERTIHGEGENKVVQIEVNGMITNQEQGNFLPVPSTVQQVDRQLTRASGDEDVRAVLLSVNSPGGGVTASDKIYNRIEHFKENNPNVFVMALMDGMATSGGYYISAPTEHIMAQRTTTTGSIGVIMQYFVVEGLLQEWGIQQESIVPEETPEKDPGPPFSPMDEETREIYQGIVTEHYETFVDVVNEGRPNLDREDVQELADGRIFTGPTAQEHGLVDEIGFFGDALARIRSETGFDQLHVIEYRRSPGLFGGAQMALRDRGEDLDTLNKVRRVLEGTNPPEFLYMWSGKNQISLREGR